MLLSSYTIYAATLEIQVEGEGRIDWQILAKIINGRFAKTSKVHKGGGWQNKKKKKKLEISLK